MSQAGGDQFAQYIGAVALELLGEPNKSLSSNTELRYGSKGSLSVDLTKGVWKDHSEDKGGGVLGLIERETGHKGKEAVEWLREHGFHIEDNRAPERGSNRNYQPRNDNDDRSRDDGPPMKPVKTWDYVDEKGNLLFQVVRMENGEVGKDGKPQKTYRQRRPDSSKPGGWDWSTKGVRQVPYRLPDLIESVKQDLIIFVVEGEKAADRLIDLGIPATTNARGALKWVKELNPFFKGARVVVLADDDPHATTADGAFRYHPDGRPIFVGIDHAKEVATHLLDEARDVRVIQLTDRQKKEDVVDWLDQGGQVEDLYDLIRKAPRFEPAPFQSRFNAVEWSALDDPGPQHEFLIKGILTRGETSICGGASQAGKSFLIIDIGMAVARGVEWFGKKVRQGLVIYQAGEGAKGVKKRLKAYRKRNDLSLSDPIPFVLMPAQLNLFRDDDPTNAFIEECKHFSKRYGIAVELIVIDTFSKAMTGANENDGRDIGAILERCNRISSETGAHVCLVHHMNAEGSKLRGHTSILANLENVLIVSQAEGLHDTDNRQIREILVDKQKDGERGEKIKFVLAQEVIGHDEDGDPITSCVVQSPQGDVSDAPIPERPSISDGDAMLVQAIERAVADHGMKPSLGSKLPQSLRVVELKQVAVAYDSLVVDFADVENETADERTKRMNARRQAMKRSSERLIRKGIIGRDDPWIWLTGKSIKGYRRDKGTPSDRNDDPPKGNDDPAPQTDGGNSDLPEMWGED